MGEAANTVFIREYRLTGVKKLSAKEAGDAVYPFLGPERTAEDVESARSALEKAYHEKGFQTVSIEVPEQRGQGGIIVLKAVENPVGQLRVKGSRFFDLERIKKAVPSLSPGTVPNFNQVTRELMAINNWPDRRITPELLPGKEPGTVDINLNVEDKFPLHGSVELNNRYSANTTPLRLNASINYNNLWQLGHAIGFSYITAPERRLDAEIFSGYYLLRLQNVPGLTLMLQGTKQDSKIVTTNLGSLSVASPGHTLGVRANITLPGTMSADGKKNFYQSLSLGFDYKHYDESLVLNGLLTKSEITYFPFSVDYYGSWVTKGSTTDLSLGAVIGIRAGDDSTYEFEQKRYGASGNFVYLHGELSHERDLAYGWQGYVKVQGQLADQPLVNTEQVAGGGLSTVRGYLEAETLGDNAIFGTVELRTPSLLGWIKKPGNEWRLYAFADGGYLSLRDPLPEQEDTFNLASVGFGSQLRLLDHLNGSFDLAWPLVNQSETQANDPRVTFRMWADF